MPGSASASRCRSLSLFGLLQVAAATDTTEVADPEVRIRVQVTDNQTQKRRSELKVRKSYSAQFSSKAMCVCSITAHAGFLCLAQRDAIVIVRLDKDGVRKALKDRQNVCRTDR
jgi:hypothetical protein